MTGHHRLLIMLVAAACGGSAPPRASPGTTPTPAPRCEPPPANASSPTGAFAFTHGYADLKLYRIDVNGCASLVATIDAGGPFAFASIDEAHPGAMPALSIDTWLVHGDRRRTRFAWLNGRYVQMGRTEEIAGPRR
jgi:hypothetical protein